jgi:hypothetical protein
MGPSQNLDSVGVLFSAVIEKIFVYGSKIKINNKNTNIFIHILHRKYIYFQNFRV